MSKVLVIFKGNWADEMDVEGFDIISKAAWDFKKLEVEHTDFPQMIGVGTNEELDYESAKQYLSEFQVHEISDSDEATIRKYFGKYTFGNVPWLEGNAPESFYKEHGYCPD